MGAFSLGQVDGIPLNVPDLCGLRTPGPSSILSASEPTVRDGSRRDMLVPRMWRWSTRTTARPRPVERPSTNRYRW